jgi:phage/plasmid-associated DNA primase
MAKDANPSVYKAIVHSELQEFKDCMEQQCNEYTLAKLALALMTDIIKVNDELYYFETYWIKDTTKGESIIRRMILDVMRAYFESQYKRALERLKGIDQITDDGKKEAQKVEAKARKISNISSISLGKSGMSKYILDFYRMYLPASNIQFDKNPYLFCFQNKAFDLQTNKEYEVKREDYITLFVPYDYVPSTSTQLQKMEQLVNSILPKEDAKQCFMSILRSGMIATCFEYFVMLSGTGGNGKGLIMDLFNTMSSVYCYKGKVSTLLNEIKSGADPEIANMNKKRCVRFAEVPDNAILNLGTLKDITGGGVVNARKCYSNETNVILQNTTMFECNKKPKINSQIDEAIQRRFINIHFPCQFTVDQDKLALPNYLRGDPYYKTAMFQQEFKTVLFDFLLTFKYTDIIIPPSVRKSTLEYLMDADELAQFMESQFVITNNDSDIMSLKTITQTYKSVMFKEGSRNYKMFNDKAMLSKLKESFIWKVHVDKYFNERYRRNGIDKLNVFVGIKMVDEPEPECNL